MSDETWSKKYELTTDSDVFHGDGGCGNEGFTVYIAAPDVQKILSIIIIYNVFQRQNSFYFHDVTRSL